MEDLQTRINRINEETTPHMYLGLVGLAGGIGLDVYGMVEAADGNIKKAIAAGLGSLILYATGSWNRDIYSRARSAIAVLEASKYTNEPVVNSDLSAEDYAARQAMLDETWAGMTEQERQAFRDAVPTSE